MSTVSGKKIFFSVGDPSGDLHTSGIIEKLRSESQSVILRGIGGPAMVAQGFDNCFEFSRFNKMGYWEVLKELPFFMNQRKRFFAMLAEEKPDLLVCVDFSGFNRPLMKEAHRLGIPVLWFIAPMIWIWKRHKHGPFLAKYASHIATIFPFEPKEWEEFTPNVSFVGNPSFYDSLQSGKNVHLPLSAKETITLALVPGSREMEVRLGLPIMVEAARFFATKVPQKKVVIKVSRTEYLPESLYHSAIDAGMELVTIPLENLYQQSDIALTYSGTATLQAALQTIPHLICYRASFLTALIMKILMPNLRFIGLPNLVAGEKLVPEYLQYDMNPKNLSSELVALATNDTHYQEAVNNLGSIARQFDGKEPTEGVVNIIHSLLEKQK